MNDITVMRLFEFAEFTDEENDKFYIMLEKFGETIWEVLREIRSTNHHIPDRFTDYIYNDFIAFMAYLTFCPIPNELIELQLEAYINGAMPCGWYGKYPEGKLAVYVPLSD